MDQSTKKMKNESDGYKQRMGKNLPSQALGGLLFTWQQNYSVGGTKRMA